MHVAQKNQSIARAVRYMSHVKLPKKRQRVRVYTYAGNLPLADDGGNKNIISDIKNFIAMLTSPVHVSAFLTHKVNIERHVSKYYKGVLRKTGFSLLDYFINPTTYIHKEYTDSTSPDTMVIADTRFQAKIQSQYMRYTTGANILSDTHTLAKDCKSDESFEVKINDFHS